MRSLSGIGDVASYVRPGDGDPDFAQSLIAAGLIGMRAGVDDVLQRHVGQLANRGD